MVVNVSEAKAQLSSLLDRVYHGETVTIAKNNLPIADLVKHQPRGKRRLGLLRGRIVFLTTSPTRIPRSTTCSSGSTSARGRRTSWLNCRSTVEIRSTAC